MNILRKILSFHFFRNQVVINMLINEFNPRLEIQLKKCDVSQNNKGLHSKKMSTNDSEHIPTIRLGQLESSNDNTRIH